MTSSLSPLPVEVRRMSAELLAPHGGLHVHWSDGRDQIIPSQALRQQCPCASCQENRGESTHHQPLGKKPSALRVIHATADEALFLERIWSVGNYALGIRWGDGHDSGIYSFTFLRTLIHEER